MKYKLVINFIALLFILLPTLLIQLYVIREEWLAQSLIAIAFLTIFYCVLLLYGILKKSLSLMLILPASIFLCVGFLKLTNHQSKKSDASAAILITAIDSYKKKNGKYPNTLIQLRGKHLDKIPTYWRGVISSEYLYHRDATLDRFMVTQKFGEKSGRIWREGGWEYYGPYAD